MVESNGTIYKWQVWCLNENEFEYVWSATAPTTCPNNASHVIDPSRTSIVEEVRQAYPTSEIGTKIWVHSSSKPQLPDRMFFIQWVGAGDDANGQIGGGDLLHFHLTPGTSSIYKDAKFYDGNGLVFIHEGYCSYNNAGHGDYLDVSVWAEGSPLQTVTNLDLIVDADGEVKYSPLGPGTGTHGFAAEPILVGRRFLKLGNWDYDPINGLRPNFTKTGEFDIYASDQEVHKLVCKLPVTGTSNGLTRLVSEDTTQLPNGYFLRITATNTSNTEWNANVLLTVYREKTFSPVV